MVEFNYCILANLILSGFQALRYESQGNHGVVTPVREYCDLQNCRSYTIPIGDLQCLEMAAGVDEFEVLIDEKLVFTNVLP